MEIVERPPVEVADTRLDMRTEYCRFSAGFRRHVLLTHRPNPLVEIHTKVVLQPTRLRRPVENVFARGLLGV